jgi:phage virion morphogenesis protein
VVVAVRQRLAISFKGIKDIVRTFERNANNLLNKQAKLKIIGQYVAEIAKQSFTKQSDPSTGSGWAPLAPTTVKQKARLGYSSKALIKTGQLRKSIGYSITKDTVFTGPADFKGLFHQEGTVSGGASSGRSGGGRVHIPARPFMGLSPKHEREIEKITVSWIRQSRR